MLLWKEMKNNWLKNLCWFRSASSGKENNKYERIGEVNRHVAFWLEIYSIKICNIGQILTESKSENIEHDFLTWFMIILLSNEIT